MDSAPSRLRRVYTGTAGWSLSHSLAPGSRPDASGLQRYAEYFGAVEINSTFYRLPRAVTIERWRDATPPDFRFTLKLPRSITHEARLADVEQEVEAFCALVARFEHKLGALLVQLPPSFEFDARLAAQFFVLLARCTPAPLVIEPRHISWFGEEATSTIVAHGIARAAVDPACCPAAARPVATPRVAYFRWHGSPRVYFSAYPPEALGGLARAVLSERQVGGTRREVFCFFDNTALGAAAVNALALEAALRSL